VAINVLTYGAILIEFVLAFFLWFPRNPARGDLRGGIALHGGIMVIVNIPIFGELMIASYLTFLTPDELDTLLRTLDPRSWFGRRRRSSPVIPGRVDGPSQSSGPHSLVGTREPSLAAESD